MMNNNEINFNNFFVFYKIHGAENQDNYLQWAKNNKQQILKNQHVAINQNNQQFKIYYPPKKFPQYECYSWQNDNHGKTQFLSQEHFQSNGFANIVDVYSSTYNLGEETTIQRFCNEIANNYNYDFKNENASLKILLKSYSYIQCLQNDPNVQENNYNDNVNDEIETCKKLVKKDQFFGKYFNNNVLQFISTYISTLFADFSDIQSSKKQDFAMTVGDILQIALIFQLTDLSIKIINFANQHFMKSQTLTDFSCAEQIVNIFHFLGVFFETYSVELYDTKNSSFIEAQIKFFIQNVFQHNINLFFDGGGNLKQDLLFFLIQNNDCEKFEKFIKETFDQKVQQYIQEKDNEIQKKIQLEYFTSLLADNYLDIEIQKQKTHNANIDKKIYLCYLSFLRKTYEHAVEWQGKFSNTDFGKKLLCEYYENDFFQTLKKNIYEHDLVYEIGQYMFDMLKELRQNIQDNINKNIDYFKIPLDQINKDNIIYGKDAMKQGKISFFCDRNQYQQYQQLNKQDELKKCLVDNVFYKFYIYYQKQSNDQELDTAYDLIDKKINQQLNKKNENEKKLLKILAKMYMFFFENDNIRSSADRKIFYRLMNDDKICGWYLNQYQKIMKSFDDSFYYGNKNDKNIGFTIFMTTTIDKNKKILELYEKCKLKFNEFNKQQIQNVKKQIATKNIKYTELKQQNINQQIDLNAQQNSLIMFYDDFLNNFLTTPYVFQLKFNDSKQNNEEVKKVKEIIAKNIYEQIKIISSQQGGNASIFYKNTVVDIAKYYIKQKIYTKENNKKSTIEYFTRYFLDLQIFNKKGEQGNKLYNSYKYDEEEFNNQLDQINEKTFNGIIANDKKEYQSFCDKIKKERGNFTEQIAKLFNIKKNDVNVVSFCDNLIQILIKILIENFTELPKLRDKYGNAEIQRLLFAEIQLNENFERNLFGILKQNLSSEQKKKYQSLQTEQQQRRLTSTKQIKDLLQQFDEEQQKQQTYRKQIIDNQQTLIKKQQETIENTERQIQELQKLQCLLIMNASKYSTQLNEKIQISDVFFYTKNNQQIFYQGFLDKYNIQKKQQQNAGFEINYRNIQIINNFVDKQVVEDFIERYQ